MSKPNTEFGATTSATAPVSAAAGATTMTVGGATQFGGSTPMALSTTTATGAILIGAGQYHSC